MYYSAPPPFIIGNRTIHSLNYVFASKTKRDKEKLDSKLTLDNSVPYYAMMELSDRGPPPLNCTSSGVGIITSNTFNQLTSSCSGKQQQQ